MGDTIKKHEGLFLWGMAALFGVALLVFALHNIISYDVWWQIKGRVISFWALVTITSPGQQQAPNPADF